MGEDRKTPGHGRDLCSHAVVCVTGTLNPLAMPTRWKTKAIHLHLCPARTAQNPQGYI